MDKPMPSLFFYFMSFMLSIRDTFKPPVRLLEKVGVKPGDSILDYGCGPGGYTLAAAEMTGEDGKVYALDIHPVAGKRLERIAERRGLGNIETICSDCATGLPESSLDVALLYDIIHMLSHPDDILRELNRTLKKDGVLSVNCHHWDEGRIRETVLDTGLFELRDSAEGTFNFAKAG